MSHCFILYVSMWHDFILYGSIVNYFRFIVVCDMFTHCFIFSYVKDVIGALFSASVLGILFSNYLCSTYLVLLCIMFENELNNNSIASLVQLVVFLLVSRPTIAYTKSGRALRSNSSNSLHSFSHHLIPCMICFSFQFVI